ncbi:MAG: hypothetical protein ROO76_07840 [Terriglobia bacterium]|jgi:hypothetical protein|nr:hypothetical protein [Terriglobia bacterium]
MQRTLTALLLFLFTLPAWAQSIPGTFNRMPPRRDVDLYSVPVITTPQISFGSGLTPPVISLGQEQVVSTPTGTYPPSLLLQQGESYEENQQPNSWPYARLRPVRMARFDFVVAPTEGVGPARSETESLGEAADSMRKGPPPTQHTYTNQDIDRLNNSNQNFSTPSAKPQEQPAQPPSNVQPQKQQLQENQRSPFAPQLTADADE